MRISLLVVGRLKDGPERILFDRYWQLLEGIGRKVALIPEKVLVISESRAQTSDQRRADEGQRLLSAMPEAAFKIALDEHGRQLDSVKFANELAARRDAGIRDAVVAIGGPDGHGSALLARADLRLAFGTMTLPHGLIRIVAAEQLYRAATILSGHQYHRA